MRIKEPFKIPKTLQWSTILARHGIVQTMDLSISEYREAPT